MRSIKEETLVTAQPMKLDFQDDQFIDGYRSLFMTSGKLNTKEGIDITREEYKKGFSLFGFDVSPSICNVGHTEPKRQGTLKIDLEFQEVLQSTISIIVHAEFENNIIIDKRVCRR